jgi:ABC-type transport system substrate-binding protein
VRLRFLIAFRSGWSFATLVLVFALPACHPLRRASTRTLVVIVPSAPLGLVPNTINEDFTLSVLGNVYESLVDLDPTLQLRPGLAESWYTSDETTWVFRLRKGVLLHDGHALRASDVVASLNHARNDPDSRRRVQLAAVQDVSAKDASTIVIRTAMAFNALPLGLRTSSSGPPTGRTWWEPGRIGSFRRDPTRAFSKHSKGIDAGHRRFAESPFGSFPRLRSEYDSWTRARRS